MRIYQCMREPLDLDKQLRGIRGSLRVEVAKKVQLEEKNPSRKVQARGNPRQFRI